MASTDQRNEICCKAHPSMAKEGFTMLVESSLEICQPGQIAAQARESRALQDLNSAPEALKDILYRTQGTPLGVSPVACTWQDVIESMDAAIKEYESQASSSRLRSTPRNQALVTTLLGLTDMIPEQNGLSVLRGGLSLVFKLVQRRIDNQERITNVFKNVPIAFSRAVEAVRAHPGDETLVSLVRGLYATLLEEIPKLVDILLRRHKSRFPSRIIRQHPEEEASVISRGMEMINRATLRVSQHVDVLNDRTVTEMHGVTRLIENKVQETYKSMGQVYSSMQCIHQTQLEIDRRAQTRNEDANSHVETHVQRMMEKIEESTQRVRGDLTCEIRALKAMFGGPPEIARDSGYSTTIPSQSVLPQLSYEPPSGVSLRYIEIMSAMDLPKPDCLSRDLDEVLRGKERLKPMDQHRGNWLLVTDRFRHWVQHRNRISDLILVDGHLGDSTFSKISPLSVLAASLACVHLGDQFIVLYHFCSLHAHPSDAPSGPIGMIRMLVAQLALEQMRRDKTRVIFPGLSNKFLEHVYQHSLGGLSVLFQELIGQMSPGMTVYCVLDNVSDLETHDGNWSAQLSEFVGMLQSMISRGDGGLRAPVFKLLMTAASRSISLCDQIDVRDCISMSAGNLLPHPTHSSAIQEDIIQAMVADE